MERIYGNGAMNLYRLNVYKRMILGRYVWKKVKRVIKPDESTVVILFPDDDSIVLNSVISQLDEYVDRKYWTRVVFLYSKEKEIYNKCDFMYINYYLEPNEINNLMQYFRTVNFFECFIVASLEKPEGNTVGRLIKSGKMNLEELIKASILV